MQLNLMQVAATDSSQCCQGGFWPFSFSFLPLQCDMPRRADISQCCLAAYADQ